jgi:phage shock protein C
MTITDELERLSALHVQGRLSDAEFERAKARVLHGGHEAPAIEAVNRLRRSRGDRWIAGVCGGIAAISGVESWVWRLILATLALFGGTGVLLYILLWIFVPDE